MTATKRAEIATMTDTGKTVTHRGVTYSILTPPTSADPRDKLDSPYVLRSSRGRLYALTRNRPKPHLLFGIALYGRSTCLPGWFSDEHGALVSLG